MRTRLLVLMWGAIILSLVTTTPALASSPRTGIGGNGPALTISVPTPPSGPAGATIMVSGSHWVPNTTVQLSIGTAPKNCANATGLAGASGQVDATGAVDISFTWPTSLAAGTYPICGDGPGAPSGGIVSVNSFTELTQATPSIAIPATVTSGSTVSITGTSWVPVGASVEILVGPQGGNLCANSVATLTSQNDGALAGSFLAPVVSSNATYVLTAVSPAGTCSGAPAPTMHFMQSFTINASSGGTPTPTPVGGNTPTPTPSTTATPTTGIGHGTPTPGHGTPTPTATSGIGHGTPTPIPGPHVGGPCPPLPNSFCSSNSSFPWWLLTLMILGLVALFIILLLLLLWRRNQEVIVTDEDITSGIDPNSVAPMGTMRFVRAVRITTQTVDRSTGAIRNSSARDYDEFSDASGNIQRRPRA